jgi:peptidoglycan/xylan/chitin deacetylase (PgdA/CDA1 family)
MAFRRHPIARAVMLLALLLALFRSDPAAAENTGAVVLLYHRFAEPGSPSTNVSLEQFEAHLAALTGGGYQVLPLPEILAARRAGRTLAPRTVAITIDDANLSAYRQAWPRLRQAGLPFTLFLTTGMIDDGAPGTMSWDQVRELLDSGLVSIGNHTRRHDNLLALGPAAARAEITAAQESIIRELGVTPRLFAYPYGLHAPWLRDLLGELGFEAAFSEQSGAISASDDRFALPRFPISARQAAPARFRLTIDVLPLPVLDPEPAEPALAAGTTRPAIAFTLPPELGPLDRLGCYLAGAPQALRRDDRRVFVDLSTPLPTGRSRLNCTLPGTAGRWHWYGRQFYRPWD